MAYKSRELEALGDATRREIFERLADRPRPVGELADELPVTRPAVSQHLRVLERAGLVTHSRHGSRRVYQLDPTGLMSLRGHLEGLWERALRSFEQGGRER